MSVNAGTETSVKTVNVSAVTVEDAFSQSGLNFIAESAEMINSANGKTVEGKKIVYRSDNGNQLGIVGTGYGIVQNSNQFAFANSLCEQHNISLTKVREFRGGSIINIEAEIKDRSLAVNVGDEVGLRINLWNSFDGTTPASASFGALRLVCKNGLVMQDKNIESIISIKHTKNAVIRFEESIRVWAGFEKWFDVFKTNVELLNQKMVNTRMVNSFLDNLLGESDSTKMKNKKNEIENLFVAGKGNHGKTAWELYNSATEYVDHFSMPTEDARLEYASIGGGYDLKAKAFSLALELN